MGVCKVEELIIVEHLHCGMHLLYILISCNPCVYEPKELSSKAYTFLQIRREVIFSNTQNMSVLQDSITY